MSSLKLKIRYKSVFYGWYLLPVFGAVMLLATVPLFHAMGIWAVAMERAFGWNRTKLSLALSFTRIEGGILGPVEGYLVDRFGTRLMVLIGLLIMGIGWVLFSLISNIWMFYFSYLIIALGQGLGSWLALNTMLNNWFIKRRSFAMGVSNSLARIGTLFLIPLLAWMVDPDFPTRPGWSSTALFLGIFIILAAYPLTRLIRNTPEEYGEEKIPGTGLYSVVPPNSDGSINHPKLQAIVPIRYNRCMVYDANQVHGAILEPELYHNYDRLTQIMFF